MICTVRRDVIEMMTVGCRNKETLERVLVLVGETNRAKGDFLSSMSHNIRTPMDAVTGMTTLVRAHLDERGKTENCLCETTLSSRHLLSLINNIPDMSKTEQPKIAPNNGRVLPSDLLE